MHRRPQHSPYLVVAHRAGNRPETVAPALERADMVELDAHVFRGRVEVRHAKVLRPTSRLWEKWYLLPENTTVPSLKTILDSIPPEVPIMVDLKCFTPRAGRRIRREVPEDRNLIVSCRSWWVLPVFRDRRGTVMLRSCRSRLQLRLVTRIPGLGDRVGVVAHQEVLDPDNIRALRGRTPNVFTWAVESIERGRELVEWGVTGLIVDDLGLDWDRLHIDPTADPC